MLLVLHLPRSDIFIARLLPYSNKITNEHISSYQQDVGNSSLIFSKNNPASKHCLNPTGFYKCPHYAIASNLYN